MGIMQWGRCRRSARDPELPPASRPLPPSGLSLLRQDLLLGPQASAAALQARGASCGATHHGVPSAGTGTPVPDTNSRALGAGPPVRGRLQAWSQSCPRRPVRAHGCHESQMVFSPWRWGIRRHFAHTGWGRRVTAVSMGSNTTLINTRISSCFPYNHKPTFILN